MTSRFPDLEVYLKRVPTEDIVTWLESLFESVRVLSTDPSTKCLINETMPCTISENVAKGGYTSLWFKTNQTPWATDHDCAQAAFDHFQCETRCSTGGWEGEDDGGWLRITVDGTQTVNWHST
tara:strand:- start:3150 stop:3518 length:369 start_codon:yes stop_codon:yes gene_type:complete